MIDIGRKIKTIRELKNLTQNYLADQLGMSSANYSNIEAGKTDICLSRLEHIAKILEVDYHKILDLNTSQIFNSSTDTDTTTHQTNTIEEELLKQLKIKDEQIQKLNLIIEKMMIN